MRAQRAELVSGLRAQPIPVGAKGWPAAAEGMPVHQVAAQEWRVLNGDLPLPALVLREEALHFNIRTMAKWCRAAGVLLAPHAKTTMAPQIFDLQLGAGAWALTAATFVHARLYRHFGVQRILLASQLVEPQAIAWFANELDADPDFELVTLVDSVAGAKQLSRGLQKSNGHRQVDVMIEVGELGGRTGVRAPEEAVEVAQAVTDEPRLRLVGIEGFEGLLRSTSVDQELPRVEAFLNRMQAAIDAVAKAQLFVGGESVIISAGGSAFFDRVVDRFRSATVQGQPATIILRSGAYVTQDDGAYRRLSALGDRATTDSEKLRNAIEVWSVVLSRPEPDLVILNMGKRDAPNDIEPPTPVLAHTPGEPSPRRLTGRVVSLTDQHAHVRIDPACRLASGDLVGATVSHPCTAFDRWRLIPVIDENYHVVDAIYTFF